MDPTALRIVETLRTAGHEAFFAGGCVRDLLLGSEAKDIDIATSARPEDVQTLFRRTVAVGAQFGVIVVLEGGREYEVATFRSDGEYRDGRHPESVAFTNAEGDAQRRDLTINGLFYDPVEERVIDFVGGRADLDARCLRVVDPDTFGDDSLRVLRALQFAARFELEADATTRALCSRIALDDLPAERIWGEVEKLLLQAARPSIGFRLAFELGVVDRLWPELRALVGCEQEPEWHPEGDVWIHTLMVIDEARKRIDDLPHASQATIMLGAVCHDFGKPATTAFADGRIRSLGHEEAGVEPATSFLDRLNVHTIDGYDVRLQVLGLVAHHLKPGMWHKANTPVGDGAFRRLARKVDLELLARLAEADCHGRTGTFDCSAMGWFVGRARMLGVEHAPPARLVLGRHVLPLGVEPGPRLGRLLDAVYERQLDGAFTTTEEGVALARKMLDE